MKNYKLTNTAETEIDEIYEYTLTNFGLQIAQQYVLGLQERIEALHNGKISGEDFSFILPGLLRFEYMSHSIYYQLREKDVLIVRVVLSNQDPASMRKGA